MESSVKSFPIYDQLMTKVTPNKVHDWKKLCHKINSFPLPHAELLYALILHHYLLDMQTKLLSPNLDSIISQLREFNDHRRGTPHPPYGLMTFGAGKGIIFTVNQLPDQLQQLVAEYVNSVTSN